ncbi:MAG: PilZ domain-containing protein [Gammaproteobacteria bacterium]|jgi:hypothetical protein|nr:PilZ domain-containing protein [Gammaproteobacteria bacterium]
MPDKTDERRRFHRIATDKPVRLRDGDMQHSGTVLDISLQGLLLESNGSWKPTIGTRVRAGVRLGEEMPEISMDGEIAHIDGKRVGLRCVGIDLESASMLRRMVELNLGDGELLERDLSQLLAS